MSITTNLGKYTKYNQLPNHRFNSWNHCFNFFQQKFLRSEITDEEKDYLSLHLSFYLASWGMYRGSAQLLQKDYKIFYPVIDVILAKSNSQINCISYTSELNSASLNRIIALSDEVKRTLKAKLADDKRPPSHTLISKILLGTLCCVPALDNYFVSGFRKYRTDNTSLGNSALNTNTLRLINHVFIDNQIEFMPYQNMGYPDAKLIDMAFWEEGIN